MGFSKQDIINVTMGLLGLESVYSLDEQTPRIRAILSQYESARRFVLELHDWKFASQILELTEDTDTTVPEGYNAFQIPSTVIKPRSLWPEHQQTYWTQSSNYILTTLTESIQMRCTIDCTDTYKFSASFCSCFASYLAYLLARPLTGCAENRMGGHKDRFITELTVGTTSDANTGSNSRSDYLSPSNDPFSN